MPFLLMAQNKAEIDSLMTKSLKASQEFDYLKSLELSQQVAEKSAKINYRKGMVNGNFMMAYDLCNIGNYKESINYLKIIQKDFKDSINANPGFNYIVLDLYGRNYLSTNFKRNAIKVFKEQLLLADKFDNEDAVKWYKCHSYVQLAACYEGHNKDSLYYYLGKALFWHKKFRIQDGPKSASQVFFKLADYHIDAGNLDSANYYIARGIKNYKSSGNWSKYRSDLLTSRVLLKQNKYDEALKYSFSALEDAKEKSKTDEIVSSYKLIAEIYKTKGETGKELAYLSKYSETKDSLETVRKDAVQASADLIAAGFEEKEHKTKLKILLWSGITIIITFLFAVYIILVLKKRKNKVLAESKNELSILQTKVNDAYEEIIQLAKNNDPAFLGRFKEVYPEFCKSITEIYPDIKTSELIFCAYLKLNFSTKDIASYLFLLPKTVQNRKNRIRKKLNIPSEEDLYVWMDNLDK